MKTKPTQTTLRLHLLLSLLLVLAPLGACDDATPTGTEAGADIGADTGGDTGSDSGDGPVATHKLNGVWGSGPSDVWVVGDGGTILRNQGGGFEPVVSGTQADLNDVWGVSTSEVYFVGDGVALVYDGTSVKPAFTPTNFNGKAVNLWRIGGEGSNAWTGGSDGAVFKLSSGGSWRSQIPYESQGLTFTDAWAADASTAYVVLGGLAAGVWKHDASGFNQVVMPTETLTAIWGSSASDVWVTARDGKMLHYDGSNWATQSVGQAGTDYRAIWGSGASDVWALTRTSAMHYDGSQWTQSALAADQSLNAIWGSAADDIWAVGDASTIMHYDGSAWTKQ